MLSDREIYDFFGERICGFCVENRDNFDEWNEQPGGPVERFPRATCEECGWSIFDLESHEGTP